MGEVTAAGRERHRMLRELRIKNFVLVDELRLPFGPGLNILTGETGAGKSVLIDALSGVLGEKMTTDMIRTGFDRAVLEGEFDVSGLPDVRRLLDEAGIDCDDGVLMIRRELNSNGKGRCFANATQIPVARMAEIAAYLVDIHGQNEHQNIVRIAKHRELLDAFAGHGALVDAVRALHARLGEIKEKMDSFEIDEREKARRIEYLAFAVREIEQAKLSPYEEDELRAESTVLANAERLFREISTATALLKGDGGIVGGLKKVEQSLAAIAGFDANITDTLESVKQSLYAMEDVAAGLREYERSVNFSPERVNEVEERLALISSLKKKYGSTVDEILEFRERSLRELEAFSSSEEEIERLRVEYREAVREAKETALDLSERRKNTAKRLEELVMKELRDLGMAGTVFRVSIKREIHPDGIIEADNKTYMLYPHGLDRVEFLLSANEGEDLRALARVASGGELSRIMLALKNVILASDIVESLVFDEVDAGIGGKTAEVVGKKLKTLSRDRQVLVITHLPQIAAMSDSHFIVKKEKTAHRFTTIVKNITRSEKVREVARMLAGETITELSLRHAEEMVSRAEGA